MDKSSIGVEHFKVRSYQMDTKARLTLTSIADFLQESAGNHADSNGFGFHHMQKSGLLWVLTRMKIKIHRLPVWNDELELSTWVVNREKFFSRRDFEIKSKSGKILISAGSGWMLIDFKRKRPHLVDNVLMNIEMFPDKLAINEELIKIEDPTMVNSEKLYHVKYSDLDIAQHTNNTQYQRIILDTFSFGFRNKHHIKAFEINYLAEALIDEGLKILTSRTKEKNVFVHEIQRTNDKKIICRAISGWEED